ncbi:MAG TPA: phytanoyl-CoA dioxygenase family protein [Acidimicrobiales bacterium]
MTTTDQELINIREVTDTEVTSYWDKGWAYLPQLIEPSLCDELLQHAKVLMGESGADHEPREGEQDIAFFTQFDWPGEEDSLFSAVALDPRLGRNAARLLGSDISVRILANMIAVKLPRDLETNRSGKGESLFHQDQISAPFRGMNVVIWIALTEITPEMGAMRFYEGSHKLGWLSGDPLEWPRVHDECPLSEPLHYMPGDATAHGSLTIHGAPENESKNPRWAFIANYFPADALYSGNPSYWTKRVQDDLEIGKPLEQAPFSVVYEPAKASS